MEDGKACFSDSRGPPRVTEAPSPVARQWMAAPVTLADNATITEISLVDLPTILAGLSRDGVKFQDEILRDEISVELA